MHLRKGGFFFYAFMFDCSHWMGYAILKISSKNTMFFERENGEKVMKSFRMKMICILLGVSLVPLIVATVYSYNIFKQKSLSKNKHGNYVVYRNVGKKYR